MKTKNLFQKPITWLVFVLLAVAGIIYTYLNFDKANSLVNVEIEMDRHTAMVKAARLAKEFNLGPDSYKQAAAFRNDTEFQNFVELEAGGLDAFKQVIASGYYFPYQWTVRHFKEQETNEVKFCFKPDGSVYGFTEKIPEAQEGKALTATEAKRIAEESATLNWHVKFNDYEIIEESKEEQTNGRIDHIFIYERNEKISANSGFRLKLIVSGDKLTSVDYHVKIPEEFKRTYAEMRSANDMIATVASAIILLLYGLLGVIIGIFILLRSRRLIWKPAILWGLGIAFASVFLVGVNHLPFAWFTYDTSSSQSNFLSRELLMSFLSAMAMGGMLAITFMSAEGLGRMAFPKHIQWWRLVLRKNAGSLPVLGQVAGGYLFAIIIIAFDVMFYVTTTTHFGWWSPAGTLSDPNILATYLPWFDSIAISLQAGFWEEALFRAVPIAGIFILTKGKKSQKIWIVLVLLIQTLVFGAGHANYPQQPAYARVIEMVVPFVLMGIIYIYYGILPAVIAHYAVDVFWFSLPLWVTSVDGIWIDRIFVLLFLLLPLFVVLLARAKNRKWLKIPQSETNQGWVAPEKTIAEEKQEHIPVQTNEKPIKSYNKILIPLSLIALLTWLFITPFKPDADGIDLAKKEAVEIAKQELEKRYGLDINQWKILTTVEDNVDVKDIFVWRTGGKEPYAELLNNFLAPPHWKIRLVKTTGKADDRAEEYEVRVEGSKKIIGVSHKLPEKAAGKNLEKETAQHIVDSVLINTYGLHREKLKEVSVTPEKLENRTDWEFVYADTLAYTLSQGQGRYRIKICGSEVSETNPFVHVPEEWYREYKKDNSKKSVIKISGNIILAVVILLGLIIGIIRWTRREFHLKAFLFTAVVFFIVFLIDGANSWTDAIAAYNTQVPITTFIATAIIGLIVAGIFMPTSLGVLVGVSTKWLPVKGKTGSKNILYAVMLGLCLVAIIVITKSVIPQTKPIWPKLGYLNASLPIVGIALSGLTSVVIYPAFTMVLFMGIHHYTKSFTAKRWAGGLIALLAGLAIVSGSFNDYTTWLVSGIVIALCILTVYVLFVKNHFEWIPITFGLVPILQTIKEVVLIGTPTAITGGIISVVLSVLFILWWYRLLLRQQLIPKKTGKL
jgi:hypothetical protein